VRARAWSAGLCLAVGCVVAIAGCDAGATGGGTGSHRDSRGGDDAGDPGGESDAGLPAVGVDAGPGVTPAETDLCGNGLDDDIDGVIDDGCSCAAGATQSCYPGYASELGAGPCARGTQTCAGSAEFGSWGACEGAVTPVAEVCDDGVDDDCNGVADDGCPPPPPPPPPGPTIVDVTVSLDGDCLTASCPPEAPYPVGCSIVMSGGDERGCVASTPTGSVVYFQEGDACGAGHVSGTLRCSSEPGAGLNEGNCMINKDVRYYPTSRSGCPDT